MNIFYSRTINNPLYAVKLTGKLGKYEIGYISAYDKNSPFLIPYEEGSNYILTNRKSLSNIIRIKRTLKDDSYIGFILTDRQVNKEGNQFLDIEGYNRIFGLDGSYRFLENYSFTFQVVRYITKEINYPDYKDDNTFDNGKHTLALDGESFVGNGAYFELSRSARHWNFVIDYSNIPPEARRDNGYLTKNNYRILETNQSFVFYPETKLINRITPGLYADIRYNHDGILKELLFAPKINIQFAKQISLYSQYYVTDNERFGNIYHQGVRRFVMDLDIYAYDKLRGWIGFDIGKYIVRNSNPYIGWGYNFEINGTLKLFDRLVLENDWNYYELAKSYGGEKIYAGYILRNKSTFQVDNRISLRLITQYDSFSGNFNLNPLFSYKLNPFTIFYVGSTYNYDKIENTYGISRYVLSGRQFFMKFQYLWRI